MTMTARRTIRACRLAGCGLSQVVRARGDERAWKGGAAFAVGERRQRKTAGLVQESSP
jgi:hypothetical protein